MDAGPRLFGYPALATVMFLIAAILGLTLVVSAMRHDRNARPAERSGME